MSDPLYFGFALPDHHKSPFLAYTWTSPRKDWEVFLGKRQGLNPPRRHKRDTTGDALCERHKRYYERLSEIVERYGCELVKTGCEEEPDQWFVALKCDVVPPLEVDCFEIRTVDLERMQAVATDESKRQQLREFCSLLGLPYQEPRWHLLRTFSKYDW
jgi:hypothetical protein